VEVSGWAAMWASREFGLLWIACCGWRLGWSGEVRWRFRKIALVK